MAGSSWSAALLFCQRSTPPAPLFNSKSFPKPFRSILYVIIHEVIQLPFFYSESLQRHECGGKALRKAIAWSIWC